jgi:hypothetical protein
VEDVSALATVAGFFLRRSVRYFGDIDVPGKRRYRQLRPARTVGNLVIAETPDFAELWRTRVVSLYGGLIMIY